MGCGCGCGAAIHVNGFTVPTADSLRCGLGQSLIPTIDSARDIKVQLGLRPYRVRIVVTRFSGPRRGMGVETVVREEEILPVPHVMDMGALEQQATPIGTNDQGSIAIEEISGRYGEDLLSGVGADGSPVAPNECVYWEVEFFRRDGRPAERRRFQLQGVPGYDADRFQWRVLLTSAIKNRARSGEPVG